MRSRACLFLVVVTFGLAFFSGSCRSRQDASNPSTNSASPTPNDNRGMTGQMPEWMMSRGQAMDSDMMRDIGPIKDLLTQREKIQRSVEEIPNGIRAVTTSTDPEITKLIRTHVREMKSRIEDGHPIRAEDPLFREIFRHHDKIRLEIEDVPGNVRVTETSTDPQVVLLIRQRAQRAESEFVSGGMKRAMHATPIPEAYGVGHFSNDIEVTLMTKLGIRETYRCIG